LEPGAGAKRAEVWQPAAAASVKEASALRREQVRFVEGVMAGITAGKTAASFFFTGTYIRE
jgi:hypothetical protein